MLCLASYFIFNIFSTTTTTTKAILYFYHFLQNNDKSTWYQVWKYEASSFKKYQVYVFTTTTTTWYLVLRAFFPSLSRYVFPCFLLYFQHFLHNNNNKSTWCQVCKYEYPYIRKQTGGALVPCRYPIFSNLYSGTSGTTSLLSYQPVIPVASGAIGGHITTKLHELKTVLDAGRGWWNA